MKKVFLLELFAVLFSNVLFSQTNTLPASGNVGIGTTDPQYPLDIFNNTSAASLNLSANSTTYRPGIRFVALRPDQNGIAMNMLEGYIGNISTNVVRAGTIGTFGTVSINPGTSTVTYMYFGAELNTEYNNNTFRLYPNKTAYFDGNVGIGTTSPSDKLVVNSGNISFTTPGNYGLKWAGGSRLYEQTTATGSANRMIYQPYGDRFEVLNTAGSAFIAGFHGSSSATPNRIIFYNGLVIGDGTYLTTPPPLLGAIIKGSVGIGTTSPNSNASLDVNGNIFTNSKIAIGTTDMNKIGTYSLAVNGDAIFTKAVVKLNSAWPDYVFTPDYKMPKLDSLESFINCNGHLPEIPTAEDVRKNGIDLGENQAMLLKKIEELTLIVIEQNKRIENQQKIDEAQTQKISELEKKLNSHKEK